MIILIADDEPMVRIGLRNMLEELCPNAHSIFEARNGVETMELVKKHRPHLAFVDITMPLLDGLSAIDALGKGEGVACADTRWVILTGSTRFDYVRQAIKLGVFEYLLKPVSVSELSAVIQKVEAEIVGSIVQNKSNGLIARIQEYIHVNYINDIGIDSISQVFGFSPNYLSKLFHDCTGARFIDYLTQVRVEAAKQLLSEHPMLTVKQVSERVGYHSARHFTSVFLKYSDGVYPSEYQKRMKEKG
jgi:YesN/AraC family two-component response regulator